MFKEMALVIWMTGLVTHVGDDTVGGRYVKEAAAVVADQYHVHQAGMVIIDSDSVEIYVFRPRDRVEFHSGVSRGYAVASDDFERFTPTLVEPLTNSLIDEPVKEKRDHDAVLAWIFYPEGTLDITGLKYAQAKFYRGNDFVRSQCVPAGTLLTSPARDKVTIVIRHVDRSRTEIEVDPDAFIWVVNEPFLAPNVSPTLHFKNYGGLLERRYGVVRRSIARVETGSPCNDPLALEKDTTVGALLAELLATHRTATNKTFRLNVEKQRVQPASHAAFDLQALLRILISDDPACTNTDWP